MRKSLFLITLGLLLLAACGGGKRYHALMHEADSLLTAGDAVTAYRLLAEADSQKTAWSRREEMDYELLKAQAQNRAYVDFQTDSVLRVVARYYDRHGTPNQRLRAHYLLGCAYRDLHEAPLALLSWEDAVACADTLSPDCDFATLFRVYGQMAGTYFRQFMPEKELAVRDKYCHYALLARDTLNYIRGLLLRNDAYRQLGDTAAIFKNIQHVRQLYLERGLTAEAAQVFPTAIQIALESQQFENARQMMHIFETKSGLFDQQGNIASTRELYYYLKGIYYLGINKLDSAEYWFRQTMNYQPIRVDACRGLLALYKQKNNLDSIYKYAILQEKELGTYLKQTQIAAITQAEGMYDYSRQHQIAQEQEHRANNLKLLLIILLAIVLVVALRFHWIFYKRKEEKQQLLNTYYLSLDELEKTKHEADILRHSALENEASKELLKDKEEQIEELELLVANMKEQIGETESIIRKQKLEESEIVKLFHFIAEPHHKNVPRAATTGEWDTLMETIRSHHPNFYYFIQKQELSELKQKVCILSYLGFDSSLIVILTNANKGSVSNARKSLAQELFHLNSARELNGYLREL